MKSMLSLRKSLQGIIAQPPNHKLSMFLETGPLEVFHHSSLIRMTINSLTLKQGHDFLERLSIGFLNFYLYFQSFP